MPRTIAIFLHQPKASVQSANGIFRALGDQCHFKIFTEHTIEDDFFEDVDMVCFPGGLGDADSFDRLMRNHRSRIRDFVRNGGCYLGICMGAYWADRHYFDILEGARVRQYITSPHACTRRPHPKHISVLWRDQPDQMYFYDGCVIEGDDLDIVARYANGRPMAAIQGNIGLIGCHPEAESSWYQYHSWMRKIPFGSRHDRLSEFVNILFSNK